MPLLKPAALRRRTLRRPFNTLGCPMLRNQPCWCRGLCAPIDGHGICGRLAPHAMRGRTQVAIAAWLGREQP